LVPEFRSDRNVSDINFSNQSNEKRDIQLTSHSLPNPECSLSSEVVNQKSPACVPVSALVWAEAIAHVNEVEAPEVDDATQRLSKRPSLTSYKYIGEPDSPICVPVSALVWGEELALSLLSAGSDKGEIAAQHPSLSLGHGTVASHSICLEASTLGTKECDLRAIVRASDEGSLSTDRKGESRLWSDIIPEAESVCCELLSGGNVRLVCDRYEYDGEVQNNKPHGWGLQKFKDLDRELSGLTYRGNFVDGLPHCSRGVAVWSSGLEFSGEFKNGCPILGSLTEPDGTSHRALFPQTGSGFNLQLSEISERHILEAISRGKIEDSDLKEGQVSWNDQANTIHQDQLECSPRVSYVRSPTEECNSAYEQQFSFLRNLFPDCEEPVITGILGECGGDVGKAIEFLLPAEDVRLPQEKKRRGRRLPSVLLPKSVQTDQAGSRTNILSSGWAAHGDLARRLNVTTRQEQLTREFPGLSVRDVEEALKICGGDIDETRQQLLILEMSRRDLPSSDQPESFSTAAKSSLWAADRPRHRPLDLHAPFGGSKLCEMVETPLKERAGSSTANIRKEGQQPASGETSASAAAEAEAWRVSTSKRVREVRPNACARARCPAEQYEGMGGDELRRLGFQHAKMNADLSRMAVAAFQAGDRIEAARLSEKALRHQEQFQVLNEMARARIIETFNPDMDGRLCVDLHQLFVAEALELLEAKLRQWAANAAGRRLLVDVVTGAGNHSREGRAVLRPRVKAWLEERGMRYYPINDGMLKVDVSTFPRG
jgi:DNA-nicking Smr family endonuclease